MDATPAAVLPALLESLPQSIQILDIQLDIQAKIDLHPYDWTHICRAIRHLSRLLYIRITILNYRHDTNHPLRTKEQIEALMNYLSREFQPQLPQITGTP